MSKNKSNKPNYNKMLNDYSKYTSIIFQTVFIIGASAIIGLKIDDYFKIKFPIFVLIFSLGSIIIAMWLLIKNINNNKKNNDNNL